jgi:membrane protein implicated in regulation of membrane protease activity
MYVSIEVASCDHEQSRGTVSQIAFPSLAGRWLWYVWAVMAIVVVVGYWHVRRTLRKRERTADAADAEARRRAKAKHHKTRHGEIE